MNKKEVNEIKKNLCVDSSYMTVNNVLTAYVDTSKKIAYQENRLFSIIPEVDAALLMDSFKKSLSGSLGKGLTEYSFTDKAYESGDIHEMLIKLNESKLKDETTLSEYLTKIVTEVSYAGAYYISVGSFSYSIPSEKKDKDDEVEDTGEIFNFIITSISPVNLTDIGFYYNEAERKIEKKSNTDLVVAKAPSDAIMFPTFSERTADVNSFAYYTKTPKKPCMEIIVDIMCGEFVRTSEDEKNIFINIMTETFEDTLKCDTLTKINNKLLNILAENKNETELPTIGINEFKSVLKSCSVDADTIDKFEGIYKAKVGADGEKLNVINIVDQSKTNFIAPDISVNVKNSAADKVHTEVIKGQKCLIINLDDPTVAVNGIDITV